MFLPKNNFLLSLFLPTLFVIYASGNVAVPKFEAVGCFKDNHIKPRPLPILVANLRPYIDWRNPNKTIDECAKRTLNHPYLKLKYFGIQFFGECYSGVEGENTYNKDGPSNNCAWGLGKQFTNFVYRFVEKATSPPTQPLSSTRTRKPPPTVAASTTTEWTSSTTNAAKTSPSTQPVTVTSSRTQAVSSTGKSTSTVYTLSTNSPTPRTTNRVKTSPSTYPTSGPVAGCECLQYEKLSSKSRSIFTVTGKPYCDRNLPRKWYRFTGPAGTRMPNTCIPCNRCGTHAPGWLKGANPSEKEGAVTRTVCFHWKRNCCHWQTQVQVRNCGGYFVYRLSPTNSCHLRYCGNGLASLVV